MPLRLPGTEQGHTVQSFISNCATQKMPVAPDSRYGYSNTKDGQRPSTRSRVGSDFLDDPFLSITSTITFLALCVFVITSAYVLIQKYRCARKHQRFSFHARPVPNLQTARALSSGMDVDRSRVEIPESELATADLFYMREGPFTDNEEFSPIGISPYGDTESDKGHSGGYASEGIVGEKTLQRESGQYRYFTPTSATVYEDKALWSKGKRAGKELEHLRKTLRSRMIMQNRVVVGQVGDSGLAQRRRTASNRSM